MCHTEVLKYVLLKLDLILSKFRMNFLKFIILKIKNKRNTYFWFESDAVYALVGGGITNVLTLSFFDDDENH